VILAKPDVQNQCSFQLGPELVQLGRHRAVNVNRERDDRALVG
jgi:hypothetical protein